MKGILLAVMLAGCQAHTSNAPLPPQVRTLADVEVQRRSAIIAIFGHEALPDTLPIAEPMDAPFPQAAKAARLHIPDAPDAYYITPKHPTGRLSIYHAGHDQRVLVHGSEPIKAMLKAGYQVVAIDMPATPHGRFRSRAHPLAPFLAPVAIALNYAERDGFMKATMMGLSGGGWTTVVYSAIDPRITASYPVAGSWPFYLRDRDPNPNTKGDFEQFLPGLSIGYRDLYLMAASEGRIQVQVFNDRDPCCFAGLASLDYQDDLHERAEKMQGNFSVIVVANDRHEVPTGVLGLIFPSYQETVQQAE